MSNFAFGTYRISDINPLHVQSIKEAVESGVKIIDTSPNYMNGGAERAIAAALDQIDEDKRESLEIISKFGYIQGSLLSEYKKDPSSIEDEESIVKYSEDCYHSISRSFMQEQLTGSLERLNLKKIDCYLVHNPEYYLFDALNRGVYKDERLDEMYRRLEDSFIGLEEEIKKGRILSYGVSSNSFSLHVGDEGFLPYEDLLTLAQNAAQIAGNKKHSFTTIQLPVNMIETEGLKCAAWAKENGLRVLTNRPLNARYNDKMVRLADYDDSRDYFNYLNELLDICDMQELEPLYNLFEQLDMSKHRFEWIGDYDIFLYTQIIPHIKNVLQGKEQSQNEALLNLIDMFLREYKTTVSYECSKKNKEELKEFFKECSYSMQECALKFLMQNNDIDHIIVGMRKRAYVHQILSLEK